MKIPKIRWPYNITHDDFLRRTNQQPDKEDTLQRCWRWIFNIRCKHASKTSKRQFLTWNPKGRGRPRNNLCPGAKTYADGKTWRLAQNQDALRKLIGDHRRRRDEMNISIAKIFNQFR
ncbi:hypothetical protein DPMN_165889 [Dreissena polymorpha]|uniref:Uncharacterized protein n=1 Tax=Dreissena polymorpha TaxID=45954 RepID=A0A9D4IV12_DREPO|nr:hypothetical protein DPMN_165889 [Dreissena polymorpha]